jgi:hypothetical protein
MSRECTDILANMFAGASTFNQDISGWTSRCHHHVMFFKASNFSKTYLDGTSQCHRHGTLFWNASLLTRTSLNGTSQCTVGGMFTDATAFNQDFLWMGRLECHRHGPAVLIASTFNEDISLVVSVSAACYLCSLVVALTKTSLDGTSRGVISEMRNVH